MGSTTIGKRRLKRGAVIALIGPDGVGKSTQSNALVASLSKRFACRAIYLGSNDGSWMRIRSKLKLGRRRKAQPKKSGSVSKAKRSWLHVHGSAIWRLVIAVQRRRAMGDALRLASKGALAIADRWPQTLVHGLMDGPSVCPPEHHPIARYIWSLERRIYSSMESHKPDLTIHLDCDFETSHRRKPGDISEEAFAARIDLMQRMRGADEAIVTVDARAALDQVLADLLTACWTHLSAINRQQR